VTFDLINSDIFEEMVLAPDASDWLESDDDTLCDMFRQQDWLDDDTPLLSGDGYLSQGHRAGRLRFVPEVW
jgi:hypothetical protein